MAGETSPPWTRTSAATSSPGRSAREEARHRALAAFLDGWGAAGGGAPA
ncbi:hypothetical protein ACFU76_16365 [Streptomyces sp. NPDC057539]